MTRKVCSICGCSGFVELPEGCECEGARWAGKADLPPPICDKFEAKTIGVSTVYISYAPICGKCGHRKECHKEIQK